MLYFKCNFLNKNMNVDTKITGAYIFIMLVALSGTLLIESKTQINKYLIAVFGLLAIFNILFVSIIPKIYSKYPSQLSAFLYNNRMLLNIFTIIFLILHILSSQILIYDFNISKLLRYNNMLGVIAGMFALIAFILFFLSQNKIIKIFDPIFSLLPYIVLAFILIHFWSMGGFWANNFVFKVLITLLVFAVIFLYRRW